MDGPVDVALLEAEELATLEEELLLATLLDEELATLLDELDFEDELELATELLDEDVLALPS
jgi:hypothetical protein